MQKTVPRALIGDAPAVRECADGSLPSTTAARLLCQELRGERDRCQAVRIPTEPLQTSFSHIKGEGFLFDIETTTKVGAQSHVCGSQVGPQLQPPPCPWSPSLCSRVTGHTTALPLSSEVRGGMRNHRQRRSSNCILLQTSEPKGIMISTFPQARHECTAL